MKNSESVLESAVERYLREETERAGGMCAKFDPDLMPGMPDRIITLPGERVCWVETKRPRGGVLRKLQQVRHKQLRRSGQRVELVWTKEQAHDLVRSLFGLDK